ncbi:MAG: dihydropteroate synthase [Deltaproteobacteria bacterium]
MGHRTLVMGILNATPDSFSDGREASVEARVARGLALAEAGADVIDVGGESTRPGAPIVSAEEETARVVPVIEGLVRGGVARISIDTTKASVAQRAIEAGACLVNDISAFRFDADMPRVVADARVAVALMHTRARPEVMQEGPLEYEGGVVAAVKSALANAVAVGRAAGVGEDAMLLDPGIGFGKTVEDNLELLRNLEVLAELGPVLVGTSRKSFIGAITNKGVEDREMGTAATVALSIARGAAMVRVHDVAAMVDVVRVADAWCRGSSILAPGPISLR